MTKMAITRKSNCGSGGKIAERNTRVCASVIIEEGAGGTQDEHVRLSSKRNDCEAKKRTYLSAFEPQRLVARRSKMRRGVTRLRLGFDSIKDYGVSLILCLPLFFLQFEPDKLVLLCHSKTKVHL